jgi:tetratricopeptide (TPR) repeat protein
MKKPFNRDLPTTRVLACLAGLAMILTAACSAMSERPVDSPPELSAEPAEPVVVRVPTDEEVMYRVFAGEYLGAEGDLAGAVEEYLMAAIESNDPDIARRATRIAYAAEAWQQAAMAADRWAQLDPENVAAHESAAAAKLSIGDYLGAEYEIIQILDLMEDSTEAWVLVSSLLARSGDPAQADNVLEHILATREQADIGDIYFARSQLAIRSRQFDRGYELAKRAVDASPERGEFLTWAGRLALNLQRTGEGLVYVRRAWKLDPEDHDLALAYADLLARNGDENAARKVMEEMQQTPDVMLSRILFELAAGKQNNAEKLFEAFQKKEFGDEQEKVFYLAQAAEALGETEQAIGYYAQVEVGERALAASIRRAELISLEGDLDGARRELEKIRAEGDEIAIEESWLAEARILRESDMREEAFNTLTVAVSQIPGSMAILYTHALLAAELGWVDIAEKGLRKVLSVQPENAAALNALGYTLADQTERYEEAEALIRQAYILQPEEASIIDSMGWVSYRLGKLQEAVRYLSKAWSLDKNPEIAAHLGEVLWMMGDMDKARKIWGEGQAVDPEDPILLETIDRLETQP